MADLASGGFVAQSSHPELGSPLVTLFQGPSRSQEFGMARKIEAEIYSA